MRKDLHGKYIGAIQGVFAAIVAIPEFVKDWGVANLIPGASLLRGAPGTAKTTLIRATAKALAGAKAVVVSAHEDAGLEDVAYDMEIGKRRGADRSVFEFAIKPRPFMEGLFVLVNEVNRLPVGTLNGLLGVFSEGFIDIRGTKLQKKPGKVWMDYNPYLAKGLDRAFVDRVVLSLVMDELDLMGQSMLFTRKYDGRHVEDLVDGVATHLSEEELRSIWEDVRNVSFPKEASAQALLSINVFRSCVHKLGSVSEAFREKVHAACHECPYKANCVTSMLRHPILTRALDSVIHVAKAFAWYDGRDKVDVAKDLIPALRLTMSHRAELKDEETDKYEHEQAWFDRAVAPLLRSRGDEWRKAHKVYLAIETSLTKGDVKEAGLALKRYETTAKDITSRCMVSDFARPRLRLASEKAFREATLKVELMRTRKASYRSDDLVDIQNDYGWLPGEQHEAIAEGVAILKDRLESVVIVDEEGWKKLQATLAKLDPNVITVFPKDLATLARGKTYRVTTKDGTLGVVVVRGKDGTLEVTCSAEASELADLFEDWDAA